MATTYGGFMGKVLRVNLSTGKSVIEDLDYEAAKKFVGGAGLAAKILYDEVGPDVEPLSAENKLIFSAGPLTGTRAPCSGRYALAFKSPLTGGYCDAHSGGFFPAEMKFAGYDVIIIEGASPKPVYLWISDHNVEIRDASHLWGKNVYETTDILENECHAGTEGADYWGKKRVRVVCIGRAGEKLGRNSCLMNDKGRAPGRGGNGAVAGFKKLKAIVIRGTHRPVMANEEEFAAAVKEVATLLREFEGLQGLKKFGTASFVNPLNAFGVLPTRNFKLGQFDKAEIVSGEFMAEKYLSKRTACHACPIACGRHCVINEEPYIVNSEGPEYEGLSFYSNGIGNSDIRAAIKAVDVCNDFGLDLIGAGGSVGFAYELYEKGFITEKDTNGLKLEWGNGLEAVKLTEMIGDRIAIGDLLAEGVKITSEKFGPEAIKFAVHVKGMESAAHEPRGYKGLGLAYATSNRGACHIRPYPGVHEVFGVPYTELGLEPGVDRFSEDGKAKDMKIWQEFANFINALDICQFVVIFPVVQLSHLVKMLNAATGFNFTSEDALKAGERIHNIQRMYNVRLGWKRDSLAPRFTQEAMTEGPCAGQTVNIDKMLDEYYVLRGWDSNGIPGQAKLQELELS